MRKGLIVLLVAVLAVAFASGDGGGYDPDQPQGQRVLPLENVVVQLLRQVEPTNG